MIVLVNPITKQPTAFVPGDGTPHLIFDGPHQNVAEVSDEWVEEARAHFGRHILENYEKWASHPRAIAAAVAAEREACAKVAEEHSAYVDTLGDKALAALNEGLGLTYTFGYKLAAERTARAIRARGEAQEGK